MVKRVCIVGGVIECQVSLSLYGRPSLTNQTPYSREEREKGSDNTAYRRFTKQKYVARPIRSLLYELAYVIINRIV